MERRGRGESDLRETILQFGTGNFLRGFFDVFVDRMNRMGLYDGRIAVVSPTDSATVDLLNGQGCAYHFMARGIENGVPVCESGKIGSIARAVNPYRSFDEFLALAREPAIRFVVSNTTEIGIAYRAEDRLTDRPCLSFPGKLTQLLYERFRAGLGGWVVLPCELIDDNGSLLRRFVLRHAAQWGLGGEFIQWLDRENFFCNTLVDRIVSGSPTEEAEPLFAQIGCRDRLLDTAEPYHFWAIEGDWEDELPLQKAGFNVVWTDNAAPYKKRKVRLLNGTHTAVVFPALLCGLETVGDCMADETVGTFLHACLFDCILPVLGADGENAAFAQTIPERFANPYIRHRLRSIALNSVGKFRVRVLPTIQEQFEKTGEAPKPLILSLAALLEFYRTDEPQDDPAAVAALRSCRLCDCLKDERLWGTDISYLYEPVRACVEQIRRDGMRAAIRASLVEGGRR